MKGESLCPQPENLSPAGPHLTPHCIREGAAVTSYQYGPNAPKSLHLLTSPPLINDASDFCCICQLQCITSNYQLGTEPVNTVTNFELQQIGMCQWVN